MLRFKIACALVYVVSAVEGFVPPPPTTVVTPTWVTYEPLLIPSTQRLRTSLNLFRGIFGAKTSDIRNTVKQEISEGQVRSLFYSYNAALATGNSKIVAKKYSKNHPVLLPTISDDLRTDYKSIKEYFDDFLTLKPQGTIKFGKIRIGHNFATDAGIYEFTMGATGAKVRARYTFVYIYEDRQWKILHHHSSTMPEEDLSKRNIVPRKMSDDDNDVRALFTNWNDALATLNATIVAQRYAKNAVLLPTVSNVPRTNFTSIKNYFDVFLQLQPQGVVLKSFVTQGDNWCSDVGIYEFTMKATGAKVKARYTFMYTYEDDEWKIIHHHSSVMPESTTSIKISETEVQGLFHLWNDALATLDSDTVAKRYANDAIVLPIISDTPRTDSTSIRNYFDTFLSRKPHGQILDSHVTIGEGWCEDVGVYEFTMGDDGTKVKGRYTFIYVFEDNEWKISHHHSSVMPEVVLGPFANSNTPTEEAAVSLTSIV